MAAIENQHTAKRTGSWSQQEHDQFVLAIQTHGKDWTKINHYVPTRSGTQIRSHAQKYFNKLESAFESREILGQESSRIMGPLGDDRQYRIYKEIGDAQPPIQFPLCSYSVKPKKEEKIDTCYQETVERLESTKHQYYNDQTQHQSPSIHHFQQECDSISYLPRAPADPYLSFFSKVVLRQMSIQQIGDNFYRLFVDLGRTQAMANPLWPSGKIQVDPTLGTSPMPYYLNVMETARN